MTFDLEQRSRSSIYLKGNEVTYLNLKFGWDIYNQWIIMKFLNLGVKTLFFGKLTIMDCVSNRGFHIQTPQTTYIPNLDQGSITRMDL